MYAYLNAYIKAQQRTHTYIHTLTYIIHTYTPSYAYIHTLPHMHTYIYITHVQAEKESVEYFKRTNRR